MWFPSYFNRVELERRLSGSPCPGPGLAPQCPHSSSRLSMTPTPSSEARHVVLMPVCRQNTHTKKVINKSRRKLMDYKYQGQSFSSGALWKESNGQSLPDTVQPLPQAGAPQCVSLPSCSLTCLQYCHLSLCLTH